MFKTVIRPLLLTAATAAVVAGTAAGPAAAAGGCSATVPGLSDPPSVTDPFSGKSYASSYCRAYSASFVMSEPKWDGPAPVRNGVLYTGRSWFGCQTRGGKNPDLGNARNNIWLYTQADLAYRGRGWGWVPAVSISGGVDDGEIPGLRWCDSPRHRAD
jgi:hypothetical protein